MTSPAMKVRVMTLFPGMFEAFFSQSMMKRAAEKKAADFSCVDLRDFAHDRHRTCDDRPFGGGPGMLLKPEPVFEAVEELYGSLASFKKKFRGERSARRFVYLTPQGTPFAQRNAVELSKCRELLFLCGHYEGVDQRIVDELVTDEISIGDYVLTQGELPAMVVIDATVRLLPGVVGNDASKEFESFNGNLLEYPQYTRPAVYRGLKVPEILTTGDHGKIAGWRLKQALERTRKRRPDLLKKAKSGRSRFVEKKGIGL